MWTKRCLEMRSDACIGPFRGQDYVTSTVFLVLVDEKHCFTTVGLWI